MRDEPERHLSVQVPPLRVLARGPRDPPRREHRWTLTTQVAGGPYGYRFRYSGLPVGGASVNASRVTRQPSTARNYTPSVRGTDLYAPPGGTATFVRAIGPSIPVAASIHVGDLARRGRRKCSGGERFGRESRLDFIRGQQILSAEG